MNRFGQLVDIESFVDAESLSDSFDAHSRVGIITGVNGSGKTTTTRKIHANTNAVEIIKRHTTKELRDDDYLYKNVNGDMFESMLDRGEFIEASRFGPGYYGTSIQETRTALHTASTVICEMDPTAAIYFKARLRKAGGIGVKLYFLNPFPDHAISPEQKLDYITRRTLERDLDHPEETSRRMKSANFTYDQSNFDMTISTLNSTPIEVAKKIYDNLTE